MEAGLNRDPVVILRIDGEDLKEFVKNPAFEREAITIFSQIEAGHASLCKCMIAALKQLTVENGMPPASDNWVTSNIIEPALQELPADQLEQSAPQEVLLEEFKQFLSIISCRLREQPVIVAHTENTFDGSGIKRLLTNKFELDKLLDSVWREIPKDRSNKTLTAHLRAALDAMVASTELPPYGAIDQVDAVVNEAFGATNAKDGESVDEGGFKKVLTQILESIMLQLQGKPVSFSSNSVIHEPMITSSSTHFPISPLSISPSE